MTYSVVTESKLTSLSRHNLLTLVAVSRSIRDKAYVTTGEVEEAYALVCEEFGEEARLGMARAPSKACSSAASIRW